MKFILNTKNIFKKLIGFNKKPIEPCCPEDFNEAIFQVNNARILIITRVLIGIFSLLLVLDFLVFKDKITDARFKLYLTIHIPAVVINIVNLFILDNGKKAKNRFFNIRQLIAVFFL